MTAQAIIRSAPRAGRFRLELTFCLKARGRCLVLLDSKAPCMSVHDVMGAGAGMSVGGAMDEIGLYYPYFHIRREAWLKEAALFLPQVAG